MFRDVRTFELARGGGSPHSSGEQVATPTTSNEIHEAGNAGPGMASGGDGGTNYNLVTGARPSSQRISRIDFVAADPRGVQRAD